MAIGDLGLPPALGEIEFISERASGVAELSLLARFLLPEPVVGGEHGIGVASDQAVPPRRPARPYLRLLPAPYAALDEWDTVTTPHADFR